MKNILLSFFLFSFIAHDSVAQPATFLKTYINGNSGYSVRELNGNEYVVAGGTDFYYNFHWFNMSPIVSTNIHLFKTNSDGNLVWEKIFNLPGSRSTSTWMEPTQDGGFIITGHRNQETVWPPDSNDVVLIKSDSDGVIQWSKILDSGKDELSYCVRQTFDGGYIVSGFHDAVPLSIAGTTYAMLIKTDASGNIEWDKMYQFAVRDLDTGESLPWTVSQTADSGYVLTGTTAGSHQADIYVIRTNLLGDLVWAKSYEHDNSVNRFSLGLDILEDSAGDIVIAASMDKDHSALEVNYPYIQKMDANGTFIKGYIYNSIPAQAFQAGFSSVEQSPDGGYLFTGMGGYSGFGNQAQILKTDVNFNMQWSRSYTWDGIATMGSRSGRSTSDGCYIFTGKRQSDGTVLMKTDFIGLVPCKTPASLLEIVPSVLTVDRFPTSISGIIASNVIFTSIPSGIDTSTECPLTPTHLPVELINFTASYLNEKSVMLKWQTASETNNDYFNIERSLDGVHFSKIAFEKGNGNTSQMSDYSFLDSEVPFRDVIYYRLRQIDYDGTEHNSKVIQLALTTTNFTLVSVKTDLAESSLSFDLNCDGTEIIDYQLIDLLGRVVFQHTLPAEKGLNKIRFDMHGKANGVYFYSFRNRDRILSGKILY
ncbi:MAG: hypothetical protein KA444_04565 [Bacteroidia bacterium]|nr:hypothetical protein [Bacteroidia bacterium]